MERIKTYQQVIVTESPFISHHQDDHNLLAEAPAPHKGVGKHNCEIITTHLRESQFMIPF